MFIPTWGDDPIWRAYFSNGLVQPPTSQSVPLGVKKKACLLFWAALETILVLRAWAWVKYIDLILWMVELCNCVFVGGVKISTYINFKVFSIFCCQYTGRNICLMFCLHVSLQKKTRIFELTHNGDVWMTDQYGLLSQTVYAGLGVRSVVAVRDFLDTKRLWFQWFCVIYPYLVLNNPIWQSYF